MNVKIVNIHLKEKSLPKIPLAELNSRPAILDKYHKSN